MDSDRRTVTISVASHDEIPERARKASMSRSSITTAVIDRLEDACRSQGISRRALSLKAGFGPNYYSEIMSTGKEPAFSAVFALLDALGARPKWILLGETAGEAADPGPPNYKEIGDRLIFLRLARSGQSAEDWARSNAMPVADYLRWESGQIRIDLDHAQRLAAKLNVTIHWLYVGEAVSEHDPRPVER